MHACAYVHPGTHVHMHSPRAGRARTRGGSAGLWGERERGRGLLPCAPAAAERGSCLHRQASGTAPSLVRLPTGRVLQENIVKASASFHPHGSPFFPEGTKAHLNKETEGRAETSPVLSPTGGRVPHTPRCLSAEANPENPCLTTQGAGPGGIQVLPVVTLASHRCRPHPMGLSTCPYTCHSSSPAWGLPVCSCPHPPRPGPEHQLLSLLSSTTAYSKRSIETCWSSNPKSMAGESSRTRPSPGLPHTGCVPLSPAGNLSEPRFLLTKER